MAAQKKFGGASTNAASWATKVAGLSGQFLTRRGKVVNSGFEPADVPDGKYVVECFKAEAAIKGGIPAFVTAYTILEGDFAGKVLNNFQRIVDAEDLQRLINRIECLGYNTSTVTLEELPQVAEAHITRDKPHVIVTVKNSFKPNATGNGETHYQAVYVDKPVDGDDEDEEDDNERQSERRDVDTEEYDPHATTSSRRRRNVPSKNGAAKSAPKAKPKRKPAHVSGKRGK
jgi:hypothetical protein